jgi:epoxyqueuosine reductase
MTTFTQRLKSKAYELGLSKIGICRAVELGEEGERLRTWLAQAYHGEMEYMEKGLEKRTDPRNVLPGAKSVVSVALNYYTDVAHSPDRGVGRISRYAWGDDYHEILKGRLEALLLLVKSEYPEAEGKVFVDTGPVMDKAWAARAGIGWQGKHTNIITREFGSWVFLGEIILDTELEYDNPIANYCGTCTLCIDACPTRAIIQPYLLDSNLCISYLTIELGGNREFSEELKPKVGNWIFGCDICQDVCPWNRKFARQTNEEGFYPREGNITPRLKELARMTQEEFGKRFRKSPVKRAKYGGFVRNVKAVIENNAKK